MLTLPSAVKIFVYTQPTDMRCGFNKLSMLAESFMRADPFSGHLFVFFNKSGDKCKILFWDRTGFVTWYKVLGVFSGSEKKMKFIRGRRCLGWPGDSSKASSRRGLPRRVGRFSGVGPDSRMG